MPHYKDLENKVHWLEDGKYVTLLPIGAIEITQEEADIINNPPPTSEEQAAELTRLHYDALGSLVHDFGDGRIIQVRPQEAEALDEPNIRNAIEQMTRNLVASREWKMADDTIGILSLADLQEALNSGQDQATALWDAHIAALKALFTV